MASVAEIIITSRDQASPVIGRVASELRQLPATGKTIPLNAPDNISPNARKATASMQALANEEIRTALANRDFVLAQQLIQRELSKTDNSLLRTQQLLTKQATVAQRSARAQSGTGGAVVPPSLGSISGSALTQIAGVTAGVIGLQAVMARTKEGFDLVVALDQSRKALGRFLGDVDQGDAVFQRASQAGRAYGVTQRETANILQSIGPLVKTSTVPIEEQIAVLLRLSNLNPAAGVDNAARALRQLASGDYAPFADSMNVSKQAAMGLRDELAKGGDVFDVTSRFLDTMGQTTASLTDRLTGTEGAARRAAQASEDFNAALGNVASSKGAISALDFLSGGFEGLANILNGTGPIYAQYASGLQQVEGTLIATSGGYDTYLAKVNEVNNQLPFYAQGVSALTSEQYAFAQSLLATGAPMDQILAKTQRTSDLAIGLRDAIASTNPELASIAPLMLQAASTSDVAAAGVFKLAEAYADGALTLPALQSQLLYLTQAQAASAEQTAKNAWLLGEHATATQTAANATRSATEATLIDAAETQLAAQSKDLLGQSAAAAAKALYDSGDASAAAMARMAAQYGVTVDLIDVYYRLEQAARAAAIAQAAATSFAQNIYDDTGTAVPTAASRRPPGQTAEQAAAKARYAAYQEQQAQAEKNVRAAQSAANKQAKAEASAAKKSAADQKRAADQAAKDALQAAERRTKAEESLMTDQQLLEKRKGELAGTTDATRRLELQNEILDLEKSITEEREKQGKAAIDAQLAILNDREKDREDARKAAEANAVIASGAATDEMKQAAADMLQRIALENQKREMEIAGLQRDAAGAVAQAPVDQAQITQAAAAGAAAAASTVPVVPAAVTTGGLLDSALIAKQLADALAAAVTGWQITIEDDGDDPLIHLLRTGEAARNAQGF